MIFISILSVLFILSIIVVMIWMMERSTLVFEGLIPFRIVGLVEATLDQIVGHTQIHLGRRLLEHFKLFHVLANTSQFIANGMVFGVRSLQQQIQPIVGSIGKDIGHTGVQLVPNILLARRLVDQLKVIVRELFGHRLQLGHMITE